MRPTSSALALLILLGSGCDTAPNDGGEKEHDAAGTSGQNEDSGPADGSSGADPSGGDGAAGTSSGGESSGTTGERGDESGEPLDPNPCGELDGVRLGGLSEIDLSERGQVFELDPSGGDYAPRTTKGNGCVVQMEPDGGLGGAPGIRVSPPTALVGENAQYCGFASGADLWSGGAVDIAQINIRYALHVGSGYAEAIAGNGPKAIIPYTYSALDGSIEPTGNSRPMVFWGSAEPVEPASGRASIGVTSGTVQSYQEPEIDYWPIGGGDDALYFGTTPDHGGDATSGTPVVGDEWIIVEHEIDLRQDRGNPEGINRLYVWTSDGLVSGAILDIPLTWDPGHDFAGRYFGGLDGIGFYWNDPARMVEDSDLVYSHVAFSANRDPGDPIGVPPGFGESCGG